MTFSPERIKKPEEPTSVRERAMQTGRERRKRLGEKIETVRDSLDIVLGSDQFFKEGLEKSREALKAISAKIGRRMEIASESLREKAEKAKGHALTRLAGLRERAQSYGWFQIEKIRGRIDEISLAAKGSSLRRELRGLQEKREGAPSVTIVGIRKGRPAGEMDREYMAFRMDEMERVKGIADRVREILEQLRINRRRIKTIRNERRRGVEARKAVMALRATGIDKGDEKRV
jgi:hypothetical protein